jgi:hypothetical protein
MALTDRFPCFQLRDVSRNSIFLLSVSTLFAPFAEIKSLACRDVTRLEEGEENGRAGSICFGEIGFLQT